MTRPVFLFHKIISVPLLFFLFLLGACGGNPTTSAPVVTATFPGAQVEATNKVQVLLVNSQLAVGNNNRFAVALINENNEMIHDAAVRFRYFVLSDPDTPVFEQDAIAERLQSSDGVTTIYAHYRPFTQPGTWGVEVQMVLADGTAALQRIGFEVLADPPSLAAGDKAPFIDTPTLATAENDLSRLTSATEPQAAFYELSLRQALANGRSTFFYLATPAFCQTQLCGPGYDTFNELYDLYGTDFNFIHVEVYEGLPNPAATGWVVTPAMEAFGLTTEPWLYLIDEEGVIQFRVEGLFAADEIRHQLQDSGFIGGP